MENTKKLILVPENLSHPQTSDFKVQIPKLEFQPKVFSLYPKLAMDSLQDAVVQTVTYKIPQY